MRFVIVTGMSGAGKTTAMKTLEDAGYFCVDNLPIQLIKRFAEIAYDEQIQVDNVAISVDIRSGRALSQLNACLNDMKENGYQYEISEGGSDFSGGQRQRLEIARAFVMEPGVMILDEATSALDVMTEQKIMGAVRKRGLTCIIIAHRLSTIRDADEIIMLEQGVVKERGTHEELMKQEGAYAALLHSD